MYRNISIAEKGHEERYLKLLHNVENSTVFRKDGKVFWQCRNCGFITEDVEAPELCPACLHPQAYFEVQKTNF
jgi:rubrerythrin